MKRVVLALALLLAGHATAQPQEASPPPEQAESPELARARELFLRGVALSAQERWGEALEFFRRSLALVERPNTLFNIAGVLVRLGHGTEAVRAYERYIEIAGPNDDPRDLEDARRSLELARQSIAILELHVTPSTAEIRVDGVRTDGNGVDRTLLLDPGSRTVQITASGYDQHVFHISALPGARGQRSISLGRTPLVPTQHASPSIGPGPWIAATVGVAAFLAGAILLAVGAGDWAQLTHIEDGASWSTLSGAYDRVGWTLPLGAIVIGAGVASIGLATGLWIGGASAGGRL